MTAIANPMVTIREGGRLAMYHRAADTPGHWEQHWRQHPPQPVNGPFIDRWYKWPLLRNLPKDAPILEAGCGNGYIVRALKHAGFDMEGLDFAAQTIDANRAVDPAGRYTVGDVRRLPHADGSLGGYLSFGVIEHFPDAERRQILAEAFRALRPGGIALVTTPYFSPLRRLKALHGGYAGGRPDLRFYQYFFSRRELTADLRAAGFSIVETDAYDAFNGIKNTYGFKEALLRFQRSGKRRERFLHHPPRWIRMLCSHMLLVVGRKPS